MAIVSRLLSKIPWEVHFTFVGLTIFILNQLLGWPLLQFWNIAGIDSGYNKFNDLSIVLRAAECYSEHGDSVYLTDFYCGNYLYGKSLLILINTMRLSSISVYLLGTILGAIYVFTCGHLIKHLFSQRGNTRAILLIFAPPFLLMIQRGHIDIFMFFLVVLSTYLIWNQRYFLGLVFISMSVLIKFYTAPLLILFLFKLKPIRYKLLSGTLLIATLITIQSDLRLTPVKPLSDYSGRIWGLFGWDSVIRRISETSKFEFEFLQISIYSIVLQVISYVFIYLYLRTRSIPYDEIILDSSQLSAYYFYTLSIVFVSCYFAGLNFDFRLIFAVIAGLMLLTNLRLSEQANRWSIGFLTLVSWLSFESGGLEIFGDVLIALLVSTYIEVWRLNLWYFFKKQILPVSNT